MIKVLFVYDYFYPAYKAGGPIQSLVNLAKSLQDKYEISVCTGCNDHNTTEKLAGIDTGKWTEIKLPDSEKKLQVWYAQRNSITKQLFKHILKDAEPAVIYLNGIFSYHFVMIPLLAAKKSAHNIVIAPRGMLQRGALAGKAAKKKLYLGLLQFSGFLKGVTWHATNEDEKGDIRKIFGNGAKVIVAPNIPKCPVDKITPALKEPGKLRLVYLSLIAEKKNLLQLIEIVLKSNGGISLDIYGPAKDTDYWETCKAKMKNNEDRIRYRGDVQPHHVQETFMQYDASILLTKGENFGHALYESLSVGRPVITSFFTPWNRLEEKQAGWNLNIDDDKGCLITMNLIAQMSNDAFSGYCSGAHELAKAYYAVSADLSSYHQLFGK